MTETNCLTSQEMHSLVNLIRPRHIFHLFHQVIKRESHYFPRVLMINKTKI